MAVNSDSVFLDSLPSETVECFKAVKLKMKEEGGLLFQHLGFIIPDNAIAAFCIVKGNNISSIYRHLKEALEDFLYDDDFPIKTLSPSNMEQILKSQKTSRILKGRTSKGKAVVILSPADWDWSRWGTEDLYRVSVLLGRDFMLNCKPTESVGAICVLDWEKYSHRDSKFWLSLLFSNTMWLRGYPSFGIEVHCVNNNKIVQLLVSNVLRFLPKKIKEKLVFHKNGYKDLRTFIDPEILPVELGGDLEDQESVYESTYERIMRDQETYEKLQMAVDKLKQQLK